MAGAKMGVQVDGLEESLRAFRALPKEASKELRQASRQIAETVAAEIRSDASSGTRAEQLLAPTVRARSDRVPAIVGGGSRKIRGPRSPGDRPVTAGVIFFGTEFGGGGRARTRQFRPHRGKDGYFFWPAIRARQDWMIREWQSAVDRVAARWGSGG